MLFKRRKNLDFRERLWTLIWPRRSIWRSLQYYVKRTLRLTATPHAIAAGVAAGVFSSITPFLGFHFLIALAVAWIVRGNLIAAAIGTSFGHPLTFPFIWGATLELGRLILYRGDATPLAGQDLGDVLLHLEFAKLWEPILKPMTVGSLPLGLAIALVFYFVTRWAALAFREERRRRLAERARRRAAAQAGAPAGAS